MTQPESEESRLERWLEGELHSARGAGAEIQTESAKLEQWLGGQFGESPLPRTERAKAIVNVAPAAEEERGEASRAALGATNVPARPMVSVLASMPEKGQAAPSVSVDPLELLPLSLTLFAEIKARLWKEDESIEAVLASHDVERGIWTEHQRRLRDLLDKEAGQGGSVLADRIRFALREAKDALGAPAGGDEPCGLQTFASIRVKLERGVALCDALSDTELDRDAWLRAGKYWGRRARAEPEQGRLLRRAMARARRERSKKGGDGIS